MTKWIIVAGLVVLNGILGIGVYQRIAERPAVAAGGIGGAPKTDVTAVAGNTNGQTIIYMLDVNSGILIAQRVDVAQNRLDVISKRNVAGDLNAIP